MALCAVVAAAWLEAALAGHAGAGQPRAATGAAHAGGGRLSRPRAEKEGPEPANSTMAAQLWSRPWQSAPTPAECLRHIFDNTNGYGGGEASWRDYCQAQDPQRAFTVEEGCPDRTSFNWALTQQAAIQACRRYGYGCQEEVFDVGGAKCTVNPSPRGSWRRIFCNEAGSVKLTITTSVEHGQSGSSFWQEEVEAEIHAGVFFGDVSVSASVSHELSQEWSEVEKQSVAVEVSCDYYLDGSPFTGGCMWQWEMDIITQYDNDFHHTTWKTDTTVCTRGDRVPDCPPFQKIDSWGPCVDMDQEELLAARVRAKAMRTGPALRFRPGAVCAVGAAMLLVGIGVALRRARGPLAEPLLVA